MKKFLVLYHLPVSFMEMAQDADPAEMQAGMDAWMAWFGRCGDQLVDMGTQLTGGRRLTASGTLRAPETSCAIRSCKRRTWRRPKLSWPTTRTSPGHRKAK